MAWRQIAEILRAGNDLAGERAAITEATAMLDALTAEGEVGIDQPA